jgi:hypothetical protein
LFRVQMTLHIGGQNGRFNGIGATTNHDVNAISAGSARGIQGVMNERPARQPVEHFG